MRPEAPLGQQASGGDKERRCPSGDFQADQEGFLASEVNLHLATDFDCTLARPLAQNVIDSATDR